ncbi:hypothetical protein Gasu2_67050 [Galdieria sulphuraria]|uniref:Uncharacterized protein n=1 Tax=Galdieria sulphuraria TaxID=130081 RepID=M2W4X6_GALSU|nr:uncharacterized protein Gasu_20240 [Galdieria sulphuraria]EME30791.1 hypothetical protein Gasu_20240 [Galdieria sulphuraria]GJD12631.1 hypothetical protein Gasu2_67050 [Galdieria sulphuraria]|eukprot:XP_005707311.1 hypothetical protein Gasu_20240 [Galdieria sulphuraria]
MHSIKYQYSLQVFSEEKETGVVDSYRNWILMICTCVQENDSVNTLVQSFKYFGDAFECFKIKSFSFEGYFWCQFAILQSCCNDSK